jgi:hypothetical protein
VSVILFVGTNKKNINKNKNKTKQNSNAIQSPRQNKPPLEAACD